MPRTPATPDDLAAAADEAWRRVRLLAVGHEQGWFEYIAGTLGVGRHILKISDPDGEWSRLRMIERKEIEGWVHGVAAAHASLEVVANLGEVPPLLTLEQAAEVRGLSVAGINAQVRNGTLYPLFLARGGQGGRERFLFADQVHALGNKRLKTSDPEARARWEHIQSLLPPKTRIADLTYWFGPDQSPNPLPVAPRSLGWQQRITALIIGDGEGWFEYEMPHVEADEYTVYVAVDGARRQLSIPGDDVLPWVLGHADVRGFPELVAYREGLG